MKNDGKKSEDIFRDAIKALGKKAFLHRITDTREASRGKNRVLIKKTPSDWILTLGGVTGYAEVKSCSGKTSFPFSALTEGQVAALHMQTAAQGEYWVFVHHLVTNTWYKLPGNIIVERMKTGIQSIKWNEMEIYKWNILNIPT